MKQADKRIRGYKVSGVPAIVVNGKYLVDATSAGGQHNIFKVVNYLIEQERK
jgi:thiol:disulfide interchange protein DsbA